MQRLHVRTKLHSDEYEVRVGQKLLRTVGQTVKRSLGTDLQQVVVISNRKVSDLYGPPVAEALKASGIVASQKLVGDGEQFKSLTTIENILAFLAETRVQRSDAIVALGGGVIGDLAGFAAAIYLRGIAFFYVPTTLLAQVDSSVGGKTGVNLASGKNLVGSFHQPKAVLADVETLKTLPQRELVAGYCEMVKQGAVGSRKLFEQTIDFLRSMNSKKQSVESPALENLIASHISFKASIVRNDEREARDRTDPRSRRILNFGHTAGHALEAVTQYTRFRHGEAVGVGMLVAGELSKNLGLLSPIELESLTQAVSLCGRLPRLDDISEDSILTSIPHDKKSLGGNVQWILLERIGRPRIINGKSISPRLLKESLRVALKKASTLRK